MGFDDGSETNRELDGEAVQSINANLTSGVDLTAAVKLPENLGAAFMGDTKGGPFDIPDSLAQEMLATPNPDGKEEFGRRKTLGEREGLNKPFKRHVDSGLRKYA